MLQYDHVYYPRQVRKVADYLLFIIYYFAEVVNGRDTFENAPAVFEQLVERKIMAIVSEDSYDPPALAASVILSHTGHTPQASPTAPTFRVTITHQSYRNSKQIV